MEDDLYGDIDSAAKEAEIQQLKELLDSEKKRNETLAAENTQLKAQIDVLVKDRTQLETNMLTLYNTAKRELKRKNEVQERPRAKDP
jgi:cell division protein FtsB